MKTVIACTLFAVTLAACNTTPVALSEARQVPAERVLAFQTPSPGKATITVVRDGGHMGGACYLGLFINETLAGRFDVAEYARFHVEPGEALLKVTWDPEGNGFCKAGSPGKSDYTQRETLLKAKENKQFRLSIDLNAKLDVQRAETSAP